MRRAWFLVPFVLALASSVAAAERGPYTKKVAILVYPGVEVLDFAGPAEVFAAAGGFGARGNDRAFEVYTVSKTRDPIVSQGFLDIVPDYAVADCPPPDILVLPGGGSGVVSNDADWMAWIVAAGGHAEHVLTVCTGAFIAGRAGFLDGIEATTWYNAVPRLAAAFPNTQVRTGRRFVDNGKIITTAGVSAGIDGSLHLVARLLGREVADRTAEYMEYKWAPESYLSSTYAQLNPQLDERDRQLQLAAMAVRGQRLDEAVGIYRTLLAADAGDNEVWLELGRALHQQKHYAKAIDAHRKAVRSPELRPVAFFNLACEYALTGKTDEAVAAAAKAVAAGQRSKSLYLNDPDLASIREDPRFQKLVDAL